MTGSRNDITDTVILPADIVAGKFTDWISINDEFTIRVVSTGLPFTGVVRVQRRNNESDLNIGTVEVFNSDTEEAGSGKTRRSMQYRIGALPGDITALPVSIYVAVVK